MEATPDETQSHEVAAAIIGAIVGALLGAWLTYVAALTAEKSKQKKLILRLYSLILLELSNHQPTLALEVDTFLPAWLLRGQLFRSGVESITDLHFTRLSLRLDKLVDEYYSRFLPELLHAELVVELDAYYRRVNLRNARIPHWDSSKARTEIYFYVRDTLRVFRAGMELFEKIRSTPGILRHYVAAHQDALEDFDSNLQRYRYLLSLCDLKIRDLESLRSVKEAETIDDEDLRRIGGYHPPDISNIPKFIQEDSTRLWEQYLDLALKIDPT